MTEILRGAVRPLVTFLAVAATVGFILRGTVLPDQWWTLVSMIVAFWFATRGASGKD